MTVNGIESSPRRADFGQISLYIDGVLATSIAVDPTESLRNTAEVTLGAFSDGSGQLAFDVDAVRVTRGDRTPLQFLSKDFGRRRPRSRVYGRHANFDRGPRAVAAHVLTPPTISRTRSYSAPLPRPSRGRRSRAIGM